MDSDPFFNGLRGTPEFANLRAAGIACQQKFLVARSQMPPHTAQ